MSDVEATPAKDRFTSLDTWALAREIRAAGRLFVDKVFDVAPDVWDVSLRSAGRGKWSLLLSPGRYAVLRSEPPPHLEELGRLTKELRLHLGGAVIASVAEPRGERVLELEARRSDVGRLRLVVEFFGKGNLVLVRDDRILSVAHAQTWAHRAVKAGAEYRPPPSHADPWTMGRAEVEAALLASRTDRIRTLATQLGLGGTIAEEVLVRAGVSATEPSTVDVAGASEQIHRALQELVAELGDAPQGYLYRRGELPIDVEPFSSHRWAEDALVQEQRFERFSDAAAAYFSVLVPTQTARPAVDPLADLKRQASRQEAAITALSAETERLRVQADLIFAHYDEAERWVASQGSAKGAEPVEVDLGGAPVLLYPDRSPRESAQTLYAELKRIQAKIAGAEAALASTKSRISAGAPVAAPATTASRTGRPARGRVHWFEKFHWFVTSEGLLVIAGRDAASNDLVVRRYLGAQDLYLHADVHGAASVVVKHESTTTVPPGSASLEEAGQWAVCYSKAWRAGHAAADAFWVTPEQVSKTPSSGEFVARGAWVIHGTKNWLRDRPLELGLGTVDYDGEPLWTAAPPPSLTARGRLRLVLSPGPDRERAAREEEIVRELGISRDLVQRLLPAGGVSVRRV